MRTGDFRFYEFDDYKIDARRRILFKNGERVSLSSRIFDLLLVLVQNEGRIMDHDELLEMVWEGMFVEQSNLKKSISALRQILGEKPDESLYIKTIPRRGYSFVADVRAIPDDSKEVFRPSVSTGEIISEENLPVEQVPPEKIAEKISSPVNFPAARSEKPVWSRNKSLFLSLIGLGLAGLIIFGAWKMFRSRVSAEDFRLENLKIQKLTTSGNIHQATLSPDGKMIVYATFDNTGKQSLWQKRIGQTNALQIIPPAEAQYNAVVVSPDSNSIYYSVSEHKAEDILYRISISGGTPRKITENLASTPTFSPDGKRFAFVRDTADKLRRLIIANSEDGGDEKEIYAVSDNHKLIEPKWSPDGKRFAFIASNVNEKGRFWGISEIPVEGGDVRTILEPQIGKVFTAGWLRDGSGLIFCAEPNGTRQTQLWRVIYPGGEVTRLTNDVSSYDDVYLSNDGNSVLTLQNEKVGDLWSMNWSSLLQNTNRLTESQNITGFFTILPDGRILGEFTENGQIGLEFLNADGTNPQPVFAQINSERTPSVTADGKTILFTSRRSGTQEIWKADSDGRNPQKLTDEKTFLLFPKQTPDGRELFFERYDGARWRLVKMPAEGGDIVQLASEFVGIYCFSPDGRSFAYSYLDEQQKRWRVAVRNLSDNSLQKQFDIHPVTLLEWTPDGKHLIYNASENFLDGGSLWLQPVDGSAPKQILEAKEDRVYYVAWSPDKQKLYLSRGKIFSNIVLFSKTPVE